jgi:putative DNA methylase
MVKKGANDMDGPKLLLEKWLPAAAVGVECMREEGSPTAKPPTTYLHTWWARRPLTCSRAAVLGSLLPADFPHDVFERLLGFARPGNELVQIRRMMDGGRRVEGGFGCGRAFKNSLRERDLSVAKAAMRGLWGEDILVMDPFAGGGSIPLEALRAGLNVAANEYNPVACSIQEVTLSYPFRFASNLSTKALHWGAELEARVDKHLAKYYPKQPGALVHAYIYARTIPCPYTGHPSPLVPDWHLVKPKAGVRFAAEPVVDKDKGTWSVRVRRIGRSAGELREAPRPTYRRGKGISLFNTLAIPPDYIKAKARNGEMGSQLYAIAVKTPTGLEFRPPSEVELSALEDARRAVLSLREAGKDHGLLPTEDIPFGEKTRELLNWGMSQWIDLFSPRQLLCMFTLVKELRKLGQEVLREEGGEAGEAIIHLLAFAIDKFANYNNALCSWHAPRQVVRCLFDRHDYAFKATFAEMAPCGAGNGFSWAMKNVVKAFRELGELPTSGTVRPITLMQGSAAAMPAVADGSVTAVVMDPPYGGNVQYSELADFFYVWLKRMQGHRRPEWFSTYLCEHDDEAVVNAIRHRQEEMKPGAARETSVQFYNSLMAESLHECHRVLRDDGVLTVMFTHKKQEAWEGLFASLIAAGFTITATWPVKTESEHSLHQAKKNAAQSTVLLVARKREDDAGAGFFNSGMREEIEQAARGAAERLKSEGLNAVDQLVGSFGPAMEVFSRYDNVMTDTGEPVEVGQAIGLAADAVSRWRVEQLSETIGGLEGVEPEGRFALLCWDVLGAAEFRFNEAKLLGHAVGMDVAQLEMAGLVIKTGDKTSILSAKDRRREKPLEADKIEETLFGPVVVPGKRRRKSDALKVHPNDPRFRTVLDACHALALRFTEAANERAGVGAARQLMNQQGWTKESAVARLMGALVNAAPEAVRHQKKSKDAADLFPEFRAWHMLMRELFGMEAPDWSEAPPPQMEFDLFADSESSDDDGGKVEEDTKE